MMTEKLTPEEQKKVMIRELEEIITKIKSDEFAGMIVLANKLNGDMRKFSLRGTLDDEVAAIHFMKQGLVTTLRSQGIL